MLGARSCPGAAKAAPGGAEPPICKYPAAAFACQPSFPWVLPAQPCLGKDGGGGGCHFQQAGARCTSLRPTAPAAGVPLCEQGRDPAGSSRRPHKPSPTAGAPWHLCPAGLAQGQAGGPVPAPSCVTVCLRGCRPWFGSSCAGVPLEQSSALPGSQGRAPGWLLPLWGWHGQGGTWGSTSAEGSGVSVLGGCECSQWELHPGGVCGAGGGSWGSSAVWGAFFPAVPTSRPPHTPHRRLRGPTVPQSILGQTRPARAAPSPGMPCLRLAGTAPALGRGAGGLSPTVRRGGCRS